MSTIERGDLEIEYTWRRAYPGNRITPGEPGHPEDVTITFRGRELRNISPRNWWRIEEEIYTREG
jgi:hypothetical protein